MRFQLYRLISVPLLALPAAALAQHGVGMLVRVRSAEVQSHLTSVFAPANVNQHVTAGDGVRTLRRGFADILFTDSSEIRLNERSDLVVEDSYTMRRYALSEGAIWVRVVKGERTVVRTPVGTATARGTVFTIDAHGTLSVLEGSVQFDAGGQTTVVNAGQTVTFSPDTNTFGPPTQNEYTIVQANTGLTSNGWFDQPGPDGFQGGSLTAMDQMSRQYQLGGDSTPTGGTASAGDVLAGLGILAGAGFLLGNNGSNVRSNAVPEPPIGLLLTAGLGMATVARRRRGSRC